jgi:RNA polymerase sigma-70 factor (ECF subfamily)
MAYSKEEILQLAHHAAGRTVLFNWLVDQWQRPLYYFIRRMVLDHDDADDLVQNTFLKAWKGLASFRGEAKISTWLFSIAYRESINFLESSQRIGKVSLDEVPHKLGSALQEDPLFEGDEIQRKLQTAIAALPEKQKAVFIMKYFEEKRYDEIAEITGTSVGALKASFHFAVKKIAAFMQSH